MEGTASALGKQFRTVLGRYRDAAELFQATIGLGYHRLTQIEKLYRMLAEAGFPDPQIPWIASMLKSYVLGFVAEESRFVSAATDSDSTPGQLSEQYNEFYSRLSPSSSRISSDWPLIR
ncbi:TetR/AcrR family transcriptional regulator C-terminal domain-containing protein [Paenibacillus sp. CC-CFT747]|nr:TetR/AcrR family transcriptional regulator C-terminal domain-containing protein [Paenibacillus sp. CC-CFT747]